MVGSARVEGVTSGTSDSTGLVVGSTVAIVPVLVPVSSKGSIGRAVEGRRTESRSDSAIIDHGE